MATQMVGTLQLRSDIVAYLAIPDSTVTPGGYRYLRMQGFTSFSISKNPSEYARQYVDEQQEQTDVTGYSPSIAFGFDKYVGNEVHDYLAEIIDNEVVGTAAVVQILTIDMTRDGTTEDNAFIRPYAVIADTEGDSMDAYTYSGNLRTKGTVAWGKADVSADGLTATNWTPS